jgi:Icc-related predicted phosphoesterase
MKIAITSDVHLEFGPLEFANSEGADVLVLSGDILVEQDIRMPDPYQIMDMKKSQRFHDFFNAACKNFKNVIYIMGNHEHYHGDFKYTGDSLKFHLKHLENLHILDNECVKIDDVTFVGGTMWSDMNKEDPLTLFHMKSMMNDFKVIRNSNREVYRTVPLYKENPNYTIDGKNGPQYERDEKGYYIQVGSKKKAEPSKFCAEDAVEEHKKFKAYLQSVIEGKEEKFVVCTHHTPSFQSCDPYYRNDELMNGGYHSNLDEYILDHPQIKLWTHGHVHQKYDYMIGETRIVCNPRGYIGYEPIASEFELKYVEI